MNKKIGIVIVVILILSGASYLIGSSKTAITPSPEPITTNQPPKNISVELSLKTPTSGTGSAALNVDLPAGSDHCEVLKKALEQGKIKDLDMRYNEEFKTNGVFVISGLGKTDSPWWVYKINGTDAPAGCSQIKVNPGDKILWEYLGG